MRFVGALCAGWQIGKSPTRFRLWRRFPTGSCNNSIGADLARLPAIQFLKVPLAPNRRPSALCPLPSAARVCTDPSSSSRPARPVAWRMMVDHQRPTSPVCPLRGSSTSNLPATGQHFEALSRRLEICRRPVRPAAMILPVTDIRPPRRAAVWRLFLLAAAE